MRILTRSPALPIPRCTEPSVTVNAHASFGYSIPLADGNYNVTLDFAETYVTAAGQRIFSVSINGTQVLTNFDIYAAAGGMNIAVQRTFPVTVTNGTLSVNFIPGAVENPKINGMEVVESSGSGSGGTSALQITTSQLPSGILSKSYGATLSASGGTTPYAWSLASGSLPAGLTLSSAGTISGTPTSAGSFPFTVQVTDTASHSASANLSVNVGNPVVSVAIASPANNATVSGSVTVSGTASDTVSVSSVQVSVDNGAYSNASGTTNWSYSFNTASLSNGSHTLTAKATDAAGLFAISSVLNISVSNGSSASDCTLFASPSGNDSNSGTSASSPKTFQGAANATQPGSVLCLLGGTYNFSSSFTPPSSGTPSSWITYKNYGDGPVNIVYTGPADASPGFHNIISNNIVAGEFDSSSHHTDGNGIILDLSNGSYNASTANTPPVLIINNVVYGNGGRCIHAYIVTNFWIVNNTCYNNNLDPTLGTAGSFSTSGSQNGYFINNLSLAWSSAYPTYIQEGSNSNIQYFADMYYGSSPNFSSSQLIQANPLFVSAPSLTQYGYSTALPPLQLGTDLTLQSGSPAFGKGIDPSTLSGLPSAIVSDLKNYIYADINGKPRPQGGGSDLGAYQH